jgi:LDH2 family malate/lactate/ureidoglycolate dehydrogenase
MTMNATEASVRAQILAILGAWGMPADIATVTAEVMVETDLMGIDSHGISMVMMYDGMRRDGQLKLTARPVVERDAGAVALMDGGAALGHFACWSAMRLAIGKARAHGVGIVTVRNSHHFGAAGYYARMASDAGMIGPVARRRTDAGYQPDRLRRTCRWRAPVCAGHGDDDRRGEQGQGLPPQGQAAAGRLGSR